MDLPSHPTYQDLIGKARTSHEEGRSSSDIGGDDIDLARLYCYAFRIHTIGAFHATKEGVQSLKISDPLTSAHLQRATDALEDLANLGMEDVPLDFRVVISTFYRYDRGVHRAIDALEQAQRSSHDAGIARLGQRFSEIMSVITADNGIHLTQDFEAPDQSSFVVPNLGITIVPLVYGDHHSWNLAVLNEENLDVPMHRHEYGVEIHLGYAPLEGYMILGDCKAPVNEGYALPIAPKTRHGWANLSGQVHHVPFIFGSLKQAGWGVFLDVQPQPMPLEQLNTVDRAGWQMSATVFLEREIQTMAKLKTSRRHTLIAASVMDRQGSGGLELSVARATEAGLSWPIDSFRAVSILQGQGAVEIGPVQKEVAAHDHFGIPAGMPANVRQTGADPLVLLDAMIKTAGANS